MNNCIQVPCRSVGDIRPFAGAGNRPWDHSGLLHFWDGFSKVLQGPRLLCCGWYILPPSRLWSEVGNVIPWQPKWVSALLHLLLPLDALRSNHGAWNFSACLFSLTVVLINIFRWSPQMLRNALGKQRYIPGQDSWSLLLLYVESEIIPLFAQICAGTPWKTPSSSSIPPAPWWKSRVLTQLPFWHS